MEIKFFYRKGPPIALLLISANNVLGEGYYYAQYTIACRNYFDRTGKSLELNSDEFHFSASASSDSRLSSGGCHGVDGWAQGCTVGISDGLPGGLSGV